MGTGDVFVSISKDVAVFLLWQQYPKTLGEKKMKKYLPLIGMVVGSITLIAAFAVWDSTRAQELEILETVGGDFSLVAGDGQPVTLKSFEGRPVLMFFGYTACPDICPTTMITLKKVKKELGEDGDKVQVLFISIDPDRDSPKLAQEYAGYFDPAFIGLSGTIEQVTDAAKKFRAFFKKKEGSSAAGYLVAHTDVIYLLDGQGRTRGLYQLTDDVKRIAGDVQKLL